MFGNMMGKLQEMQQKSEEVKQRLETISVHAEAENLVKVTAGRKDPGTFTIAWYWCSVRFV